MSASRYSVEQIIAKATEVEGRQQIARVRKLPGIPANIPLVDRPCEAVRMRGLHRAVKRRGYPVKLVVGRR